MTFTFRTAALTVSAALLVLTAAQDACAAHPFVTDDGGLVGARTVELELSGATIAAPTAAGRASNLGLGLHVGLHPNIDVGVALQYATEPGSGASLADPVIDLKVALTGGDGALPAVSIRVDYMAPQGPLGVFSNHGGGALAIFGWQVGAVSAQLNAGSYLHPDEGDHCPSLFSAAAVALQATDSVIVGLEVASDLHGHDSPDLFIGTVGASWQAASGVLSAGLARVDEGGSVDTAVTLAWTASFSQPPPGG